MNPTKGELKKELENFYVNDRVIPDRMHDSIIAYVVDGRRPGDFLYNMLAMDFRGAMIHADDENIQVVDVYYKFFYNHLPAYAWGSQFNVETYLGSF